MENILPSLIVGLIYVLINPSPFLACTLFKVGAIARVLHTIVYAVVKVPQPARALAFFVHYAISVYMACSIVRNVFWVKSCWAGETSGKEEERRGRVENIKEYFWETLAVIGLHWKSFKLAGNIQTFVLLIKAILIRFNRNPLWPL